jgi:hypothetical protein
VWRRARARASATRALEWGEEPTLALSSCASAVRARAGTAPFLTIPPCAFCRRDPQAFFNEASVPVVNALLADDIDSAPLVKIAVPREFLCARPRARESEGDPAPASAHPCPRSCTPAARNT